MTSTDDNLVPVEIDVKLYEELQCSAAALGLSINEYLRLLTERLDAPDPLPWRTELA